MKPEDPVSRGAERAIAHLNADHADALLEMARAFGGQPEATAARCLDADRTGLDLAVTTAAGEVPVRVDYQEPIEEPADLRKATVKLAHAARAAPQRSPRASSRSRPVRPSSAWAVVQTGVGREPGE